MRTLETMTSDERSLLLFFEYCAVDQWGKVDARHMNKEDFAIAEGWDKEGFVKFGRIKFHSIFPESNQNHWTELSEEAWTLAHAERKAKYLRVISKYPIDKTCDR